MLPVVALVGRPNVGKSTFFNRLTHSRDALVADFPGLTRDRQYGRGRYDGYQFIVVDTGGIQGDEEGLDRLMAEQSLQAVHEADLVLFLVDARDGLTAADEFIADYLRRQEKPVKLVANKVDGIDGDSASAEFYKLGLGDVWQIAAAHGRGVGKLLKASFAPLVEDFPDLKEPEPEEIDIEEDNVYQAPDPDTPIKLAIVGRPNVGKSTLTNRILGEDRVVVFDMPGTTRDSVYIPMERDGRAYTLIDTAGVRRRGRIGEAVEKFSVVKTLQAIEDANVVIMVIDARESIGDQDLNLLGFVLNAGRSVVIAVNKWDGLEQDAKQWVKDELDRRLGFVDFARIHFISALHGTNVGHLYESVQEAYASATKRAGTAHLTRILTSAVEEHQPPLVRGRRVKLKYAHAGGYNPPRVVIHGNQVDDLPESYKRYLMNYFRRSLGLMGTPIKIETRNSDNPFAGKKNKLTISQQRKRKRMMRFVKK
ncbi:MULTISPECIES: ribosome biogenesis GTPase Der [Gammaproteobacteria]|uniref:ribosome biogenesis GTPase Der n=1 Tax=Gammaproteobacteria TaxID=1236 RepID=UPI000DD0478C|nr:MULTISPECIES: ribosome biogenesis GTPase Der [Gammaproteobacteria]RTE86208.1 ribosome biogenesis GTPase Der [Aliidiomarina sp. B3213]TCZ91560.1 ribosome biogenesis GTPase Der [Lysobacter sp. N42]